MAFNQWEYIRDLVAQLNLNGMDSARLARLEDLKKNKLVTKDQQGWDPTAAPKTPAEYNGGTISDDDLKDLYKAMQDVFATISTDKDLMLVEDISKFVDEFYGEPDNTTTPTTFKAVAPIEYKSIFVDDTQKTEFAAFIDSTTSVLHGRNIPKKDLQTLSRTLKGSGEYNKDPKQVETLQAVLGTMADYDFQEKYKTKYPKFLLDSSNEPDDDKINDLYENVDKQEDINPNQLAAFNGKIPDIFKKALKNDKIKDAIVSKDTYNVGDAINTGLRKTNYKDGKNVLQPLHSSRKKFFDNAKSKIQGFHNDTLGKLNEKHTRHIYSTNAKHIVGALIKAGVKPTDGAGKILESLDKVSADLPSPVQEQIKWIKGTLQELSSTTQFKEALSDGHQLRTLVQDIIIKAAESGKPADIESAKVALEMLAVMRYTMTTSSVRDKLRSADFTIFSDPNLSFNKGPFKHLTAALDKTLRFGMLAAFEIGNLAKNTIRTAGTKIGKGEGNLSKDTKKVMESLDKTNADDEKKEKTMQELFAFWDFVNTSSNTKDYILFRSHKKQQKKADNVMTGTTVHNDVTGEDKSDPTAQQKKFIEWMNTNAIGRAA